MKRIMVDIETLSTAPDACIISIGVARFTEHAVEDTRVWEISSKDWTGHIDPATIKWWMNQSDEAKAASFHGTISAMTAAFEFAAFVDGADEVWANSPSFDIVILKSWWKRFVPGVHFPISYKAERDCRTIFAEASRLGIELGHAWHMGTAHSAVDDAANQARAIIEYHRQLSGPQR